MRIVYFGDGEWAQLALQSILKSEVFDVAGVVLRYDTQDPVLTEIAKKHGIKTYEFKNCNSDEIVNLIKDLNVDLGVSMSYDQIIGCRLRKSTRLGFINCHAGRLPFYRGRNILNWALINDEKEIGITVHFIDDGVDTGDIISQSIIPISDSDDYATVLKKAILKCPEVLLDALYKIKYNRFATMEQKHIRGSYFSYRRDGDEYLDWNWSSRRIFNLVRAITKPGPGAYTYYNGKKLYIWKVSMVQSIDYISTPGEIVGNISGQGCIVKTGDNIILVEKISYEGDVNEEIPRLPIGERLGINIPIKIVELEKRVAELEERLKNNA